MEVKEMEETRVSGQGESSVLLGCGRKENHSSQIENAMI